MKKIFLLLAFTVHMAMRMYAAGGSVCCPSEMEKIALPVHAVAR